jgi:hypothetical protein
MLLDFLAVYLLRGQAGRGRLRLGKNSTDLGSAALALNQADEDWYPTRMAYF